jgi:hypothetical protein
MEELVHSPGAAMHMKAGEDVLEYRRLHEEKGLLEGSGDALLRDLMGFEACDVRAVERDRARGNGEGAGDEIEDRGFARTVRSYKTMDLPFLDAEVKVGHSLELPEILGDVLKIQ